VSSSKIISHAWSMLKVVPEIHNFETSSHTRVSYSIFGLGGWGNFCATSYSICDLLWDNGLITGLLQNEIEARKDRHCPNCSCQPIFF